MTPKFNIDRPKITDEEINKNKDFDKLLKQFKEQSIKKARADESWWKNKKIKYSTAIAGITVICTITYTTLFNNQKNKKNEQLTSLSIPKQIKSNKKPFIKYPSKDLKLPSSIYKINNSKGGQIIHPSKSKINIPKNSFVDKNGKDIIGDVTISYNEFHSIADVILSGIPMLYDSGGVHNNLESAGMFNIRGYQNNESVFIKSGNKIEIELASTSSENRFNQYNLDTVTKNWKFIQKDNAITNKHKPAVENKKSETQVNNLIKLQNLKNEIETVIPEKIQNNKQTYSKKINELIKIKEPELLAKNKTGIPIFKLEANYNEFPELNVFEDVVFEVGKENKNYSKELHAITWSGFKISEGPLKGKNYVLTLSYRNRSEKLIVYPVITEDNYEKAKIEYGKKLQNYTKLIEKRKQEEKKLLDEMESKQKVYMADLKKKEEEYKNEMTKFIANRDNQNELSTNFNSMSNQFRAIRIFKISSFGIYNSDCAHPLTSNKNLYPIFIINKKQSFIKPDFVYLINHSEKSVYELNNQEGFKLNFNPNNDYSICIFDKNKLYMCSKNIFKETIEKSNNKFLITPLPDHTSLIDFKKNLEI